MKKITFLVLHLAYGGAEQAVISEANLLAEKYNVEIFCFYRLLDKPAFYLDPKVKVTYLTEGLRPNRDEIKKAVSERKLIQIVKEGVKSFKILYLRKNKMKYAIRQSDANIIISSRYLYHKLLTQNAKKNVICIAQEHNHHNNNEKYIKKQIDAVKNMDYFMPVSKELTDFYEKKLSKEKVRCKYIPHYLERIPEIPSDLCGKNLISIGRLAPEKDFSELIEVFAEISGKEQDWKLHIIGDGDERDRLQEMIQEKGLQDRVILHGFQGKEYIEKIMYQSSVYVMTSRTESFGLVLIEAQSYGLPCIAYDSAQGAKEIIDSGKNGLLIKDRSRKEMVSGVLHLMQDKDYREQLGNAGKQSAIKYSKNNVRMQWYDFIDNLR